MAEVGGSSRGRGGSKPGERRGGRAPGVPNKVNLAARLRIQEEADPVGFFIDIAAGKSIRAALPLPDETKRVEAVNIFPTLDQRMAAQRFLLNKALPDAKSAPIKIALPPMTDAASVLGALAKLVAEMAAGKLAPDEAATVAGVLEFKRRAYETIGLEERLAKLETLLKERTNGQ